MSAFETLSLVSNGLASASAGRLALRFPAVLLAEGFLEALEREDAAQRRADRLRRSWEHERAQVAKLRRQQSLLCDRVDELERELAEAQERAKQWTSYPTDYRVRTL